MLIVKNHATAFLENQKIPLINQYCLISAIKYCLSLLDVAECKRTNDEWGFLLAYSDFKLPIPRGLPDSEKLRTCHRYLMHKQWVAPTRLIMDKCIDTFTFMNERWA